MQGSVSGRRVSRKHLDWNRRSADPLLHERPSWFFAVNQFGECTHVFWQTITFTSTAGCKEVSERSRYVLKATIRPPSSRVDVHPKKQTAADGGEVSISP